jgi:hypothetical protein
MAQTTGDNLGPNQVGTVSISWKPRVRLRFAAHRLRRRRTRFRSTGIHYYQTGRVRRDKGTKDWQKIAATVAKDRIRELV